MGSIFYLKEIDGYVVGKIKIDDSNHAWVEGKCYEFNSWDGQTKKPIEDEAQFLADFYCKWDSCTHWNFRGEDFSFDDKDSEDSYYHLCGARPFTNHIRLMCFVWKVCAAILVRENKTCELCDNSEYVLKEAYFETDKVKALVEFMLDGYVIEEEEEEED